MKRCRPIPYINWHQWGMMRAEDIIGYITEAIMYLITQRLLSEEKYEINK